MMMKNKLFPVLVILLFVVGTAFGQSKKTIREKGITIITTDEYFLEEGMNEPVVESIEKFNEKGDPVEIQEFNKRGDIKRWEKYVYNDNGKMVEEIFLDEKGRVTRTEKNIYAEDLRIEKQFFNEKDYMTKRKVYKYEYRR